MRYEVWCDDFIKRYTLYDKITGAWAFNTVRHSNNFRSLIAVMDDGITSDYVGLIKLQNKYICDIDSIERFYEQYCVRNRHEEM